MGSVFLTKSVNAALGNADDYRRDVHVQMRPPIVQRFLSAAVKAAFAVSGLRSRGRRSALVMIQSLRPSRLGGAEKGPESAAHCREESEEYSNLCPQ